MFGDDVLGGGFDVFGFVAKETGGANGGFELRQGRLSEILSGAVFLVQVFSYDVDALIGALG